MSSLRSKPHVAPFVGPAWYVAAAWLLTALVLQSTLVHYLAIRTVVPSLVFVVVVWYAIRVNALRALIYGVLAGLCEDALSTGTGAAWTVCTGFGAVLASLLSRGFFADSLPLVVGITIVATLARALVFWVVAALSGYPSGLGAIHLHEAVAQSGLNAIVMMAVMLIARRFATDLQ